MCSQNLCLGSSAPLRKSSGGGVSDYSGGLWRSHLAVVNHDVVSHGQVSILHVHQHRIS